MTITGVLCRFAALYVASVIVVSLIVNYFGIRGGSGVNIAILAGCVMYVCNAFGKANKRYFSGPEKAKVVFGIILIDIGLQLLFGYVAVSLSASGDDFVRGLLIAVALAGTLHVIAIYVFVSMTKKLLVKQGIGD